MITISDNRTHNTILDNNGVDAIKKGLRLLQLVGNEFERNQANILLRMLGESIQERPNFEHGGPG